MQNWDGCHVLNIVGNPIIDINANLTFLSSRWKSWKMIDPPIWLTRMPPKIFQFRFSLDMLKDDWLPLPGSDIWWKSWKFHFCKYSPMIHANFPQTFSRSAESHLKMLFYYMLKDDWHPTAWLTRMSPKIFQFRFSLDMLKDDWPSLPGSDIWWKSC